MASLGRFVLSSCLFKGYQINQYRTRRSSLMTRMLEVEAFYDAETFYDVKHGQHYIINRILTALPLDIKTLGLYISWGVLLK